MGQPSENSDYCNDAHPDQPRILIGIDWADSEHAFAALMPNGARKAGSFKQKKTAIDEWIKELRTAAPEATIDICIETSRGGLINAHA